MKILLIGGTGFIGRHLCASLSIQHEVRVLARNAPDRHDPILCTNGVHFMQGNVSELKSVQAACRDMDCVVYMASTTIPSTSNLNPAWDIQSNLIGSVHALAAAVGESISKFVFLSSGGTVYGSSINHKNKESAPTDPISSYGIVKLAIEKYIKMHHVLYSLPYSILRISNPYGPGHSLMKPQGVIPLFLDKILKGKEIEVWGDGSIERDFVYVDDVVTAIEKAIFSDNPALLVNIGSGRATSINQIISLLGIATNRIPKVIYKPSRSYDVPRAVLDISAAKRQLDWAPQISLTLGIDLTLKAWTKSINNATHSTIH